MDEIFDEIVVHECINDFNKWLLLMKFHKKHLHSICQSHNIWPEFVKK
jgi:hypothetical protein